MKLIKTIQNTSSLEQNTAIALGMFDGVHLGHRAVLKEALQAPKALTPAVLSFTTTHHRPQKKLHQKNILSVSDRLLLLEQMGFKTVVLPDFDEICEIPPKDFIEQILIDKLGASLICCGSDFRFGKYAAGDVSMLRELCASHKVEFIEIPPQLQAGEPISATRIRHLLGAGEIELANQLLGYRYFIKQKILHGNRVGRTIGFPTVNQPLDQALCLPKYGVYVSVSVLEGVAHPSLSNIGVKPSVGVIQHPLAETHLLDYTGDLYGKQITVELLSFLRPEQKFHSLEQLKQQILLDKQSALRYFAQLRPLGQSP